MGTDDMGKESILIILIAGIGDLILASKSLRAVRNAFPKADIHLLTNSEALPIARRYHYIDRVWSFPIRKLRKDKSSIIDIVRLILNLRKIAFDMAINLFEVSSYRGAFKMGALLLSINAGRKIGHDNKGFGLFLTHGVSANTFRNRHRVDAMMDIALIGGGVSDNGGIDALWDSRCEEKWRQLVGKKSVGPAEIIVGVNPGGDRENRRWSPDNFGEVADRIIDMFDARVVLLGGPGEERIAKQIQEKMKNNVVNVSGMLDLSDLVYLISRFDLFLTNDSGPMHMAAATRTPLVAIFGPGDPALVKPYMPDSLYRIAYKGVSCQPCRNIDCGDAYCLEAISPDEIFEQCLDLLKTVKTELLESSGR